MARLTVHTSSADFVLSADALFSGVSPSSVVSSDPTRVVLEVEGGNHLVIEGTDLVVADPVLGPWAGGTITAIHLVDPAYGSDTAMVSIMELNADISQFGVLIDGARPLDVVSLLLQGDDEITVGPGGSYHLIGGLGSDTIIGGVGDDYVNGGMGFDSLVGGFGNNTLSFHEESLDAPPTDSGVTVNLETGLVIDQWGANDAIEGFQNVRGSIGDDLIEGDGASNIIDGDAGNDDLRGGGGDDTLVGGEGNDTLVGGQGHDALFGWEGDDTLLAGQGNDAIDGGDGTDVVYLSSSNRFDYIFRVNPNGSISVTDQREGDESDGADVLRNIEFISFGGTVQSIASLLSGPKDVADQTINEDGPWYFALPAGLFDASAVGFTATSRDGGPLPSWIRFDPVSKTFMGTPPKDWNGTVSLKVSATEFGETAEATFSLNVTPVNDAPGSLDMAWGGSVAENSQRGTYVASFQGTDVDSGSLSYSLVDDAGGRFYMQGNAIYVADGTKLDFEQARGHQVTMRVTDQAGASYTRSFSIGIGDVVKETVAGSTSGDRIVSGSGSDKLNGGLGNDVLTGGKGKDAFVFNTKLDKRYNVDTITDFSAKDDSFQLDNAYFRKLGSGTPTGPKLMKKDYFAVGPKAKDKNDYLVYDKSKGYLYYDADGSGKGAAVLFAKVNKGLTLTDKDFYVI